MDDELDTSPIAPEERSWVWTLAVIWIALVVVCAFLVFCLPADAVVPEAGCPGVRGRPHAAARAPVLRSRVSVDGGLL